MELIKIENGKVTSLELLKEINFFRKVEREKGDTSRLTKDKAHKELLGVIRDEFEEEIEVRELTQTYYYRDGAGNSEIKNPMYELTLSQSKQILVRESKIVRKAVIKRLDELENKIKVPGNFKEALQLAIEQQEELEKRDSLLIEQKPKVEFYDTVTGSSDTLDLGVVAKVINKKGYGRNKMFEFLRKKKILMQNNQPYQKYIDRGCFRTIETKFTKLNGDISINIKTVVYQKGVDLINKLLNASA